MLAIWIQTDSSIHLNTKYRTIYNTHTHHHQHHRVIHVCTITIYSMYICRHQKPSGIGTIGMALKSTMFQSYIILFILYMDVRYKATYTHTLSHTHIRAHNIKYKFYAIHNNSYRICSFCWMKNVRFGWSTKQTSTNCWYIFFLAFMHFRCCKLRLHSEVHISVLEWSAVCVWVWWYLYVFIS